MKTSQLDLRELRTFTNPQGSFFSFLGRVDARSEGLKRKQMYFIFDEEITRTLVPRSGFVHGWRIAETIKINS